jgi:hypothetical protein
MARWRVTSALAGGAVGVALLAAGQADAKTAPCTSASAEQALRTFLSAFNRGDQVALRGAVAPAKQFGWYSVAGPAGRLSMRGAQDYATLFSYFARRHQQQERLQETRFQWNGIEHGTRAGARVSGMQFTLRREAVGLPWMLVSGKGAVVCAAPNRLAVWSLGTGVLPGMGPLDPRPVTP